MHLSSQVDRGVSRVVTAVNHGSLANLLELSAQRSASSEPRAKIISDASTPTTYSSEETFDCQTPDKHDTDRNMNDPNLNNVLKWGVENSSASKSAEGGPRTQLNPEAIAALLNIGERQKSDPERMTEMMSVINNKEDTLENRAQAFKNFGMLIENLDNANTMEPLSLWTPLVSELESEHAELRKHAAWCCSIAVQNNLRTQERVSGRFNIRY